MTTEQEFAEFQAWKAAREQPRRANYFIRHWRGELSLGVSYWVNGTLLGIVLTALGGALTAAYDDGAFGWQSLIASLVVWVVIYIWQVTGIFRSARKSSSAWAGFAMLSVVLGCLYNAGTVAKSLIEAADNYHTAQTLPARLDAQGRAEYVRGFVNSCVKGSNGSDGAVRLCNCMAKEFIDSTAVTPIAGGNVKTETEARLASLKPKCL
jgi:hypothetical protein